jgi:fatty-acid desaturase
MGEIKRLITEEAAQTTAEYALVILGAAAVAGALIAWAAGNEDEHKCISGESRSLNPI